MLRFGLAASIVLFTGLPSFACSVPVFRYALERWKPSRYELVVYHRGPLSPADRATVRQIESATRSANVSLTEADLDGRIEPDLRAVWDREGQGAALPRLVLRYPESGAKVASAWAGPLSAAGTVGQFDSPARQAVFERLTAGHAGVVVLLLSGDATVDEAVRGRLRAELPRIAERIKLPKPTEEGPQVESELPLWIDFPVVEVARTPDEEALVRLLLGSEDGLKDVAGPVAFPVFGRGRALCSLHGKDLQNPVELQRSLEFLCGACSCQVKEMNPGIDLLISANWDRVFDADRGPVPRVVANTGGPQAAETRPTPSFDGPTAERRSPPPAGYSASEWTAGTREVPRRPRWLRSGIFVAGTLALLTGFWAVRGRRGPPAGT